MKLVIKIGTSTIAHESGRLNIRRTEEICKIISDLKNAGLEIIMVSSGAIGMGVGKLSLPERPKDMPTKQAAAAVGQSELMYVYVRQFSEYNHTVAQILITAADIASEDRHKNFSNTLNRLLELGAIPIINENDTIATDEIAVGDNDTLGALVAVSVRAELLIVLTDIDGLYTADPRRDPAAQPIRKVSSITPEMLLGAGGGGTALSTGGMATKLAAAQICMDAGTDMVIVNGARPDVIYDVLDGKDVGTRFIGRKNE